MNRTIDLRHFRQAEFRDWWPYMSLRLLFLLDSLRHQWGSSITISPVTGALGRENGGDDPSQHNYEKWGEVRAADIFLSGMDCQNSANRAVGLTMRTGFTGIGIYPHWDPSPGMHVDVRLNARPGEPDLWGMLDDGNGGQYQVSFEEAMRNMP